MLFSEILKMAKSQIPSKKQWCQIQYAVDDVGNSVEITSPFVCKLCASGAILRVTRTLKINNVLVQNLFSFINNTMQKLGERESLAGFNDTHTYFEVMRLFDALIAEAQSQEQLINEMTFNI